MKEAISNRAKALFLKQGVSRVTVDDIVLSLHISKKTFYK